MLKEIRQDIISEVGELLPQNFKFVQTGIPVSVIQEEKLHLQKCIGEKESGKVFSLSIQVHWYPGMLEPTSPVRTVITKVTKFRNLALYPHAVATTSVAY